MYNHNKAQQSKNRVHISWDILYVITYPFPDDNETLLVKLASGLNDFNKWCFSQRPPCCEISEDLIMQGKLKIINSQQNLVKNYVWWYL